MYYEIGLAITYVTGSALARLNSGGLGVASGKPEFSFYKFKISTKGPQAIFPDGLVALFCQTPVDSDWTGNELGLDCAPLAALWNSWTLVHWHLDWTDNEPRLDLRVSLATLWYSQTLADMDWTGNGLAMDSGWTVHHWQHSGPVGIRWT
ncbi:hypothetical protein B0H21DRAFT_714229 [Amylocystis lapponica]|nr:hypothetical protein B0H21DRAFT_714229 [Amylocystis lapponica]